uniref:Chemokine interleukin-8-like domain-containing protein n=1 Tax=Periophthalmus magnuspinnatus TaxID=409849 RepID=A0A3B3Z9C8_9GOBI
MKGLCFDVRRNISDIQIYPASDFCRQVEIVITNKQGGRYCLNPQLKAVKTFLTRMTGSTPTASNNSSSSSSNSSSLMREREIHPKTRGLNT